MTRGTRLIALCALALVIPTSAQAQFGGLMKRAKEKMEQKAGDQASENLGPVVPGEQLTDESAGQVLAGAQAADRVLGTRDRVLAQRQAKNRELSALIDKNEPAHRAYEEANGKVDACRSASFEQLHEARDERLRKTQEGITSDPARMAKMQMVATKYAKAMSDAQQKGDAVAMQKVEAEMQQELTGIDIRAEAKKDTAATDAKCGKPVALPAALVQDSSGALRWVRGADVARAAGESGVRWAFQSYPALLAGDSVLPPLRSADGGVSVTHRDARAGICLTGDGRLLVALTRFDAVGSTLGFVPFGLTTPEMAAVMGALGCRDAMLLDGGISARLRVRDERDVAHDFEGWRKVPLALIALPR